MDHPRLQSEQKTGREYFRVCGRTLVGGRGRDHKIQSAPDEIVRVLKMLGLVITLCSLLQISFFTFVDVWKLLLLI